MDFGAFVELEPGVEGLIHVSEMSWVKKVRKPSDLVKPGETVEAVILAVNPAEQRMSLGLKQALGDPWADAAQKFSVGSEVEGPVVSLTKFGAFVQLAEGIEGMVHVSDISAEKRINHPQDVLKVGQSVKALVLEVDAEKRRLKLGMKQLVPTSIDEYLAEHKPGDEVSGRVIEVSGGGAQLELGEGIRAACKLSQLKKEDAARAPEPGAAFAARCAPEILKCPIRTPRQPGWQSLRPRRQRRDAVAPAFEPGRGRCTPKLASSRSIRHSPRPKHC